MIREYNESMRIRTKQNIVRWIAWVLALLFIIAGVGLALFTRFEAVILFAPVIVVGLLFLWSARYAKKDCGDA